MIIMAKQDTIERLEKLVEQQMETTKELSEKLGEKNSNPYEQAIVDAIVEKAGTESREIIITDVKKQIESYVEEQLSNLPVKIELQQEGKTIKDISGIFHYRYQDILKLVNQNIPVFLKGGAGSGKNHVLEQVERRVGKESRSRCSRYQERKERRMSAEQIHEDGRV